MHALVFAERDAPAWGAVWCPADAASAPLACRVGATPGVLMAELQRSGETEPWRIEGDEVSLQFTPAGPAERGGAEDTEVSSVDQLCAVSGGLVLGGTEHEISCVGWRTDLEGAIELDGIGSFRHASAWFEPAHGLSLMALRPRKARAHDADLVAATVIEPEPAPRVAEPRLSTTYDASGLPTRVGLELWPADSSSEESDDDEQRQFPRRAAAEAIGPGIEWEVAGFRLHAALLHWHSRGSDGTGVYLLGQRE